MTNETQTTEAIAQGAERAVGAGASAVLHQAANEVALATSEAGGLSKRRRLETVTLLLGAFALAARALRNG